VFGAELLLVSFLNLSKFKPFESGFT
jgi:hypothetical protein